MGPQEMALLLGEISACVLGRQLMLVFCATYHCPVLLVTLSLGGLTTCQRRRSRRCQAGAGTRRAVPQPSDPQQTPAKHNNLHRMMLTTRSRTPCC
jgi:hypothetical protein